MTGTNHALTGALIVGLVSAPIVALPLAFASHFVLDSLPHFGYKVGGFEYALKQKSFYLFYGLDGFLFLVTGYFLLSSGWLISLGAFFALSPDFYNLYRFFIKQRRKEVPFEEVDAFTRFHWKIQKYERQWGGFVELAWLIASSYLVIRFVL